MIFPNNGKEAIEITKELKRLRAVEPKNTNSRKILRTNIMGYELGAIQQFTAKNAQQGLPENIKKGLEENAKLGMADLITQCRMLCLDCGWNFDNIQKLGVVHLRERHKDFEKEGYGESD